MAEANTTTLLSTSASSASVLMSEHSSRLSALQDIYEKIHLVSTKEMLFPSLLENASDVVIIEYEILGRDTEIIIRELKSRFPFILVVVFVSDAEQSEQQLLFEVGADDVIPLHYTDEIIQGRLQLLSRSNLRTRILFHHSQRLHALSILAQTLYNMGSPDSLIADTIHNLCSRFNLRGVAILIDNGEGTRLYAGTRTTEDNRPIFEGTAALDQYHPLHQVWTAGISLIYQDIKSHPYYEPIPGITDPTAAMIIPLKQGQQILGSMALFSVDETYTSDDLAAFEMFSTHFVNAYTNVLFHQDRELDLYSKRQLVNAWQRLSVVYSIDTALETLHSLVVNTNKVSSAAIFINENINGRPNISTYALDERVSRLMQILYARGHLSAILNEVDEGMHAILYHRRQTALTDLSDLFALMVASQIAFIPIGDNVLLGGIFVSPSGNHTFSPQDLGLLERFAYATARTIERNMLINEINLQKGRLEAIVLSIHEAIFFVEEGGQVIFCNPQFTELTGINPSQVIGNPHSDLFHALADVTPHPTETFARLEAARSLIFTQNSAGEDYPVIELFLDHVGSHIYIEFMKTHPFESVSGWIGMVRQTKTEQAELGGTADTEIIRHLMESLAIPLLEIHNTSSVLLEQYHILRPARYLNIVDQLRDDLENIQIMWQSLLEIYQLETSGMEIETELTNLAAAIEEGIKARRFDRFQRPIRLQVEPPLADVKVDADYILKALSNIVAFITHLSPKTDTPLVIKLTSDAQFIIITIQEKDVTLFDGIVESLFDLTNDDAISRAVYTYKLGMFISQKIFRAHGGRIQVESHPAWGLIIKAMIPLQAGNELHSLVPPPAIPEPGRTALSVVIVESTLHLLDSFYGALEGEGHELYIETSLDQAIVNLSLTQIDLLIIENNPRENNIEQRAQYIRSKTGVLLLIVSDASDEDNCLKALAKGADAYILLPLTAEKLGAQIQSIARRKLIGIRTTPPIQIGDLHIDLATRRVYLGNKQLDLTKKEYEILHVLAANRGQVITHDQLLAQIWGPEYRNETQYLWVNMSRLRGKLEPSKNSRRYIYTEKNVGYILRDD